MAGLCISPVTRALQIVVQQACAHYREMRDAACIYSRFPGPRENLYFPGRKINAATRRAKLSLARGNSNPGENREDLTPCRADSQVGLTPRERERDLNFQEVSVHKAKRVQTESTPSVISRQYARRVHMYVCMYNCT